MARPTVRPEGCRCKDNNKYINQTGQCVDKSDCLKYVENIGENLALKDINRCPRKNEEYVECSNICPEKTCYSYRFKRICFSLRCGGPKCQCRKGYIRTEGQNSDCVRIRDCKNKRRKSKM
uniref:TIL domain-containing protein n=1 Tax=Strongyloides papillosus TaxID=174720 RepID=A0A0N5B978_STREA